MVFEKVVIIDGRGHLLGRVASVVAKELLLGQHVVVVRCEALNVSGSRECRRAPAASAVTAAGCARRGGVLLRVARWAPPRPGPSASPYPPPRLTPPAADYRNKLKWLESANKNSNSNPRRGGPWHWRAPSRIFWKTVRGMIPHKTSRGAEAMARLKVRAASVPSGGAGRRPRGARLWGACVRVCPPRLTHLSPVRHPLPSRPPAGF